MSRFRKQGFKCDWCGKIANNPNGEYERPNGLGAGYIRDPDWAKGGSKDICEECATRHCCFCGSTKIVKVKHRKIKSGFEVDIKCCSDTCGQFYYSYTVNLAEFADVETSPILTAL